jgi:predicted enzyme related to lactoylglutathione lyase
MLVNGINHVAILTEDVDRFCAFYTEVFGASVLFAARVCCTPSRSRATRTAARRRPCSTAVTSTTSP